MRESIVNKEASLRAKLKVEEDYAIRDVDIAEQYLQTLLTIAPEDYARICFSEGSFKENESRRIYTHALNTATRRLWKNTWKFEVSIDRAHEQFVPLLKQAASKIPWREKYFSQVRGSIDRRINDLEEKYCCGVFLKKTAYVK